MIQAQTAIAAMRNFRSWTKAMNGSSHDAYHGMSQLSVTSVASVSQPSGSITLRLRHAQTVHATAETIRIASMAFRTDESAPPFPTTIPIMFGMLQADT